MKVVVALLALGLVGCGIQPRVVSSSPRSVVVMSPGDKVGPAQTMADAECAKVRRLARLKDRPGPNDNEFVFDCIE